MKRNVKRINESQLRDIVAEATKRVLNEAHVIAQQFGQSEHPGSFEDALVKAWRLASEGNKRQLENAFPDIFPHNAMYGNESEPFDFRDFPTRQHYDDYYKGWEVRNPR